MPEGIVTEAPSAVAIAQPFVAAVTETFYGLLGLDAIGQTIEDALTDDQAARAGITALIEFSGPRYGVVLVTFPQEVARATVERMLKGTAEVEEGDVTDGVGELVNIVSGRAKSVLSALGLGRLDMSVPTVLTGFSLADLGLEGADWSRIDFATEVGTFTLRVAFARPPSSHSMPLRILLADDSRVMRKIERSALQGLGEVELLEAADGVAAIELIEKNAYTIDLVVLDLKMPERDGYDVVSHVRRDARGKLIPVVVVSSLSQIEAAPRLADASPPGSAPLIFVGKPFDPHELLDAARRLTSRRSGEASQEDSYSGYEGIQDAAPAPAPPPVPPPAPAEGASPPASEGAPPPPAEGST
ncbi:response regulator [bacterium]|nr:response regulator [bacterium]